MSDDKENRIAVEAIGLSKIFRDFWNRPKAKAVDDIDFEIRQGEIVAMLGPNGSGKSTTIKMLLGLLYPTSGSISVLGASPRDVQIKRRIGYLPEESYLYKYLTAMETLDFYGALFNLSRAERKRRSMQLLEMVGLSHARNRQIGEFSKGMARRIGLAQAMINDPDLLILDEPTSGLDPLGCKEVKDLVVLLRERGKTVIVCSHLLSDVEDICDRVMILYGGKIRATGSLSELLTVSEENTITTPVLRPEVTEKVLDILRRNLKSDEFKIDHPKRTLEEFFLSVVDQAMSESIETSGVTSGGKIAEYLLSDGKVSKGAPERIIADLAKPEEERVRQGPEKEPASTPGKTPKDSAISKLLVPEKPVEEEPEKERVSRRKKKKIEEANEKLKKLLK
ncbi:MAG: ABC transporter ATP-binding protein [Victivallales bacterium]|nr:ABC transporter ATP-binding protein [Victivallales bacterium]